MEAVLREHADEIAAVIVEPLMQGSAGISFYPPEYLRRLRTLTRELDVLLILDEVATGFGRLGSIFAHTKAGVVPDFVCLSKGLSAGYLPLALTVTREEIYQAFYSDDAASKTFFHGHTYTANPLACSVAAENLKLLQENGWPESRGSLMARFREKLRAFEALDCIGDIRHQGFVGAVDLVKCRSRGEAFAPETRIGFKTYLKSIQNNLLLRPLDNTIYWFLPLCVSESELDEILEKSMHVIREVVAEN
jgi:adenosylmethionine-8-amino-7-oxononanoate aminotransferase